jgi:hypothetical protein
MEPIFYLYIAVTLYCVGMMVYLSFNSLRFNKRQVEIDRDFYKKMYELEKEKGVNLNG